MTRPTDEYLLTVLALLGTMAVHEQIERELFASTGGMPEFMAKMTRRLDNEWGLDSKPLIEEFDTCYDRTLMRWWWDEIGSKGYTVRKEDKSCG